ncbi:MAG: TlpA family protein disulfide reductase [Candidatus Coatesbacteria bacterium]|nr:MAG: TlpA family protein disulfide reductase [Candidatus Coatesbacteria bacterium]
MRKVTLAALAAAALALAATAAEEELELATASLEDMVKAARGAYRAGEEERYAELVEAAAAKFEPADVYFALGGEFLEEEPPDFAMAVRAYEEAMRNVEPSERLAYPEVYYNMACSYARLGDAGKSLDCLRATLEAEPRFVRYVRGDGDLASLREEEGFEELLAHAEEEAEEAEVEYMTVKPDEPAPDFALTDLYGKEYRLADFRGSIVVLNFWATWCPPCRQEIPDLIEFARDHEGEVVVLSVTVDDPTTDVAAFAAEYGINYPILRDDGETAAAYLGATGGIPQTYFLDAEGRAQGHVYGSAPREVFEARLARLESAAGE